MSGISTDAQAAWDLFGEVHFTGGRSGNPRLLDEEQPASARRGQMEGTALLTLGARSSWERDDLDLSYSPYGELFEEGSLNQTSHAAGLSWDHRYTPRLSQQLKETFIYNPSRPIQAGGTAVDGALLNEQGLEDGGGILANAELSRAHSDAHIPFNDHVSFDVSVSRDVRRGLDDNGYPEGTTLTTWRGGGTFTYTLPLGWSLIAMLTRDRQTATGTPGFPADIEATRYAVGASWTFNS